MVLQLIKPLGALLKVKELDIYNTTFKLHTKLTVLFLLAFSVLVSAQEVFGKSISCIVGDKAIHLFAENMCWINGTFTYRDVTTWVDGIERRQMVPEYQKYYQWIVIILILEAVACYIPAHLWKGWERGRIEQLCASLCSVVRHDKYEEEKNRIVSYLKEDYSRVHAIYVLKFIICEVMNFLIVVLNMLFLNAVFDKFWVRYLPAVSSLFSIGSDTFSNLASDLFPKLAKCTYSDFGPSGTKQVRDALCLLPLNILNEKIFAFLYIWFIILLGISGCNLIIRSILLVSSDLRLKMIQSLAMSSTPLAKIQIEIILRGDNIGDWFVLYQLGRNLNPITFREILDEVAFDKRTLNNEIL